jgi:hypothetical protein
MDRAVTVPNLSLETLVVRQQNRHEESSAKTHDFFEKSAKKVFDRDWSPPYKPPPRGHGGRLFGKAAHPQVRSVEGLARMRSLWPSKRSYYG